MDLGIRGKQALVCGASKGLGRGCAEALAADGVNLTLVARTAETLEQTAQQLQNTNPQTAAQLQAAADALRQGDTAAAQAAMQPLRCQAFCWKTPWARIPATLRFRSCRIRPTALGTQASHSPSRAYRRPLKLSHRSRAARVSPSASRSHRTRPGSHP